MNINTIREFVRQEKYLIKGDCIRHAVKEGFTRQDIVDAVLTGKIIKEKETMNQKPAPVCAECKTTMRSGQTDFLYRDDGIEITVPHVPAWLCQQNHEPLFTPETTDQLIETLRELAATAQRARVRQPVFHEYLVKVA